MRLDEFENQSLSCSECGGPAFTDLILAEKKDACYSKVRSRYKVWPSAYASGALVQCRKKGAANWGKKSESVGEGSLNEFAPTWDDEDDNDDLEGMLKHYARQFYDADGDMHREDRISNTLAKMGWEIGWNEDPAEDRQGVFVVRAGDENGDSYMHWTADQLEGLAEGGFYNPDRDAERDWDAHRQADQDFRNRERNAGVEREQDQPREIGRTYFKIPFDRAKAIKGMYGLRWDAEKKLWFKPKYNTSGRTHDFHIQQLERNFPIVKMDEAANAAQQAAIAIDMKKHHQTPKNEAVTESQLLEDAHRQFDMIEDMVESIARAHGVDAEFIWEYLESVSDEELLETAAWKRKAGKNKNGGLNRKGVMSYRREHPGSKLQTAVTTKPSKLKPGSKAAKRRKSFCARMSGMKGPMKKPNGKPTRKALALRKWNC